jgi:prolycopene isomerase
MKPIMTEGCLARTEELYPGFRQQLKFQESATPVTLERFSLNHRGALFGWENTPDQAGSKRPNQVAPIDGLFLAGHWTGPGGGFVRALLTGVQAAQFVLKRAGSNAEIPRFMS